MYCEIKIKHTEKIMWTFLLILVLVFAAVDLLVRLVIDPMASKKWKKNKTVSSKEKTVSPSIGLVGATMYDGGKSKDTDKQEKGNSTDGDKKEK
jgi:hypothetical protein